MTDQPTRAERLGLEPGSIRPVIEEMETLGSGNDGPFESEVAHSIAISLKRLADHFTQVERMTTYIRLADGEPLL